MQIPRTPNYKEAKPIDTAFINIAQLSVKTPQNNLQRPKSFSNLRKTSLDTSSNKHSSQISHFQSSIKQHFQQNSNDIYQNSQALLKHLKTLNNKSLNFDFVPTQTLNNCKPPAKPQRPKTINNKKFIDIYKRGNSITNVHVNVNVSSNPKNITSNTSNNISNTSIKTQQHQNKGKSYHNNNSESSSSSMLGKELENQTLYLIQELKHSTKKNLENYNFPEILHKTLIFFKKIPGFDPLLIALLGQLEEFISFNEDKHKEKLRESEGKRLKEREVFLKKEKDFEEEIKKHKKKHEDFYTIFDILKSQGVNFEEILKRGFKKKEVIDSDDYDDGFQEKKNRKKDILLDNAIKLADFADESLINDSEESSFNYLGKPESPLTSQRINMIPPKSKKGISDFLKLNLKGITNKQVLNGSGSSSSSEYNIEEHNKENKFLKKNY